MPEALAGATSQHVLPREFGDLLASADVGGAPAHVGVVPDDLLRVLRILVLMPQRSESTYAELVASSRSRDARVRQIAVEAAAKSLRIKGSADLEYVVTSGLFDPAEDVAMAGLRALRDVDRWRPRTLATVGSRLQEMYESYGRNVRAETVWAASSILRRTRNPLVVDLPSLGLKDRSWIVRDSAMRALVDVEAGGSPRHKRERLG